jgi:adapter protein MecA 1/2
MMEQAEVECGFDMSDSQLIIEPMPDSEDGFIITITRVDEDGDFESIHKYIKSRFRRTDLKLKKKNHKLCSTMAIYCFQNFDDLSELCKRIMPLYSGDSSLYRLKNYYYLVLTKNSFTVSDLNQFDALLNEYSNPVSNVSFYEGYLNEYGDEIIGIHAVETVVEYF